LRQIVDDQIGARLIIAAVHGAIGTAVLHYVHGVGHPDPVLI